MKNEINEIPFRAELCYKKTKGLYYPKTFPIWEWVHLI